MKIFWSKIGSINLNIVFNKFDSVADNLVIGFDRYILL